MKTLMIVLFLFFYDNKRLLIYNFWQHSRLEAERCWHAGGYILGYMPTVFRPLGLLCHCGCVKKKEIHKALND